MITITVSGNVGKDAEMRRAGDSDVCGFSLAAQNPKDKDGDPVWFDVSIWGKRGEALCKHISKGDKITVVGQFSTRENDGKTYFKVDAYDVALQGGSGSSSSSGSKRDDDRDDRRRDPPRDEKRDDRDDRRRDDRDDRRRDPPRDDRRSSSKSDHPY